MGSKLDRESEALLGTVGLDNPPAPEAVRVLPGAGSEFAIAGDAYEGASRISTELGSYQPTTRSADQDLIPNKRLADARARDLGRNDPYIRGGINLRKDNIVGAQLLLSAEPNSLRLLGKEDSKWEEEFQEEAEEKFTAYVESPRNYIDASGQNTLTQMVRMAVEQHTVHGEVLATAEWLRGSRRPYHTAIQMVDTDRLRNPLERIGDPDVVMGVELGRVWNEPRAYHFSMSHPADWRKGDAYISRRVPKELPWGRAQVLHIFEQHRPAQTRGIGTMVTAIPEMKMSRQFREIVLQNAILNATYAATIESDSMDAATIFQQLGGTDFPPEKIMEAMMSMSKGYYDMVSATVGKSKNFQIGGVKIPWLPPGSKLNLQGAGQGGPLGSEFEASLQRAQATAFGVSYEQWSRDYSKTNYSSYKGAMAETYKAMAAIKHGIAHKFASQIYRLWLEEALNAGEITSIKRNMPSFYEGQNEEWYCACSWVGSTQGQVDEVKETQAAGMRMALGLSDLKSEAARLGKDYRKVLQQKKRDRELAEHYGVTLEGPELLLAEKEANEENGAKDE